MTREIIDCLDAIEQLAETMRLVQNLLQLASEHMQELPRKDAPNSNEKEIALTVFCNRQDMLNALLDASLAQLATNAQTGDEVVKDIYKRIREANA